MEKSEHNRWILHTWISLGISQVFDIVGLIFPKKVFAV